MISIDKKRDVRYYDLVGCGMEGSFCVALASLSLSDDKPDKEKKETKYDDLFKIIEKDEKLEFCTSFRSKNQRRDPW